MSVIVAVECWKDALRMCRIAYHLVKINHCVVRAAGMTTIRSNELLNGPNRLTDVRLAAVAGKDYVLAVENAETLIVPTPR